MILSKSTLPSLRQLLALSLVLVTSTLWSATEKTRVTILTTTDMHGRIFPINYFTNQTDELGLAKIGTMIRQARKESPELLLIDVGDTIQGTPLAFLHARKGTGDADPMMLAMNALGYDSMTLGNHEFNFGTAVREKARSGARFPWLSANTVKAGTTEPAYTPYIVKEVSGVRVGVLGLTTPGIPYWDDPANYAGLEFLDTVATAARWIPVLREKEKVDLVVVAIHAGLDEDLASNKVQPGVIPGENSALALARQVPGIDVLLLGHTHRDIPALVVNGVLLCQADRWARKLGRVEVTLAREEGQRWTITSKGSTTIPVTAQIKPDEEIVKLTKAYHERTQTWLSKAIGHCAKPLDAKLSRLGDSAIVDLIHRAQLEAGGADVSLAASFDLDSRVPGGDVTVRDIYSLYAYENTMVVLEADGKTVREILEHAARYFLPYASGKKASELVNPAIPGYSFDTAEGVSYEMDLTKPYGSRIQNLKYKGAPLAPDTKLKLVTNNYRYNGGGGYTMLKNLPVLHRSSEEVRDIIIDWVEKHREIPSEANGNWSILPLP